MCWDDTSLPVGPGWLCQGSAPGGRQGTKHSFACRTGRSPRGLSWGWLSHSAARLWVQQVIPLHCAPAIQAGKSRDLLLAGDVPLVLASLGWWQWAVPKPSGLARSWEAPCRDAGYPLPQIYSPWRGRLGPGALPCPGMAGQHLAQTGPDCLLLGARQCGRSHRVPQSRTASCRAGRDPHCPGQRGRGSVREMES